MCSIRSVPNSCTTGEPGGGGLTPGRKVGGTLLGLGHTAPSLANNALALCHVSFRFHPLVYMCAGAELSSRNTLQATCVTYIP